MVLVPGLSMVMPASDSLWLRYSPGVRLGAGCPGYLYSQMRMKLLSSASPSIGNPRVSAAAPWSRRGKKEGSEGLITARVGPY